MVRLFAGTVQRVHSAMRPAWLKPSLVPKTICLAKMLLEDLVHKVRQNQKFFSCSEIFFYCMTQRTQMLSALRLLLHGKDKDCKARGWCHWKYLSSRTFLPCRLCSTFSLPQWRIQ